jgi:hypothetical protein
MQTEEEYNNTVKKFNEMFLSYNFEKNMILDLNAGRYLPF